MKIRLSIFLLCLVPFSALAQEPTQLTHNYELSMSNDRPNRVFVKAQMPLNGGKIEMPEWGHASDLKNGWTHFIENLKVSGPNGPLAFRKTGGGVWKVEAPEATPLRLHYEVRMDHANHNWDSGGGMDARPGLINGAWFMVTKALFIFSYEKNVAARVKFDLPPTWRISTSWDDEGKNTYRTRDLFDLMDNALVIGAHEQRSIRIEGMRVVLAVDRKMVADVPMITDALSKQLASYKKVFNSIPNVNYLVAIRRDKVTDGEAFNNSFNLMVSEERLQDHTIVWANTVGHEMFHYWTNRLKGKDHENFEWFTEGFTEYYASLTLARVNLVSDNLWHRKLERYFSRFFIMRNMIGEKTSLVDAGKNKIKNWLLIYGGGATVALVMDVTIRESTNGKRSLDDFMRKMIEEFDNKPFTLTDMERVANKTAGKDMKPFFEAYIRGKGPLPPLRETLGKLGLQLSNFADEYYIAPMAEPTLEQRRLYSAILHRKM